MSKQILTKDEISKIISMLICCGCYKEHGIDGYNIYKKLCIMIDSKPEEF